MKQGLVGKNIRLNFTIHRSVAIGHGDLKALTRSCPGFRLGTGGDGDGDGKSEAEGCGGGRDSTLLSSSISEYCLPPSS